MSETPPTALLNALRCMGLLAPGANAYGERLTGGLSSDIRHIDLPRDPSA